MSSTAADGVTVEPVAAAPRDGEFRRGKGAHEHVPSPSEIPELGPESYAGRAVFAPVAWHERMWNGESMEISKCRRFEGSLGSVLLSRITIYGFRSAL